MRADPRRSPPDARGVAADVLLRVESDGAFAAAALDAALHRAGLDPRDRALATELVYGTLRCLGALDEALGRHARDGARSIARLDPRVRAVLRVAAYQVLALERIPPRAAVDAAVQAAKGSPNPRLAGFVNALLRALTRERPDPMPPDARARLARKAVPPAVVTRVAQLLGDDEADACLSALLSAERAVQLRAQPRRVDREALAARLRAELPGAEVTAGRHSPWCLRVTGGGDVTRTASYAEGLFGVQEEAAQAIVAELPLRPGMAVLDVCAGRGGKSAALATKLEGAGTLHAVDLFPEKLTRLREELSRLGLDEGVAVETFAVDLTRGDGELAPRAPASGYDLVLVDAPCSGLGTLGHRPDVLLRLRDDDAWRALTATQSAILARAAGRVAPGGALVYAVCTLTRDEGPDVAAAFEAAHPDFAREASAMWLPHRDGTDGFVVRRWRRRHPG